MANRRIKSMLALARQAARTREAISAWERRARHDSATAEARNWEEMKSCLTDLDERITELLARYDAGASKA